MRRERPAFERKSHLLHWSLGGLSGCFRSLIIPGQSFVTRHHTPTRLSGDAAQQLAVNELAKEVTMNYRASNWAPSTSRVNCFSGSGLLVVGGRPHFSAAAAYADDASVSPAGDTMMRDRAVPWMVKDAPLADGKPPVLTIREDDIDTPACRSLIYLHLADMHANSPEGAVFALGIAALKAPDVTVWTAWEGHELAGMAALKTLPDDTGELKSMRTHPQHLRSGVATALLTHVIREASNRGLRRLSLETGTGPTFDPALSLYLNHGFVEGDAFADYTRNAFNRFLHFDL